MEERRTKLGKNKAKISMGGGGGGIGGVVGWGGMLAVGGLIAFFATKKSRKRVSNKKADEGSEGLRFILQTSSPSVLRSPCLTNYGTSNIEVTHIDSSDLVSTQSLILEQKSNSDHHEDIVRSDDPKSESLESSNDYGIVEKNLLLDKQILIVESKNKNDYTEEPMSMETIGENKQTTASEIPAEQLALGNGCNNEDKEYVVEKWKDIWEGPTGLIEELSLELKEMNINLRSPKKIEEYACFNGTARNGVQDKEVGKSSVMILNKKEIEEPLKINNQAANFPELRIWILTMLVLLIVLLLVVSHHKTSPYHLLSMKFKTLHQIISSKIQNY